LRRKAKKQIINYVIVVLARLCFGWRIVQVKSAIAVGVN